ncbi:MAG: NUDIX domain-containing protein [archaeon]
MGKYRSAVFIVTYAKTKKEVKYLILKRKLHWKGWEFPKGGKKFYESPSMTTRREVKEETGLKILKMKRFNISGKYKYDKKYSDRKNFIGQTYVLFVVEVEKNKVLIDIKEHSDYRWAGFKEAVKKLKWKNQKKCLKVVNDFLKKI